MNEVLKINTLRVGRSDDITKDARRVRSLTKSMYRSNYKFVCRFCLAITRLANDFL